MKKTPRLSNLCKPIAVSPLSQKKARPFALALLVTLFISTCALALVYPLFTSLILNPTYPLLPYSFSLSKRLLLLALLIGSFPLLQLIGGPLLETLAKKISERRILLLALIGEFFGLFLSTLAFEEKSYSLLLISRCLTGFFAGAAFLCLTALERLASSLTCQPTITSRAATCTGMGFVLALIAGALLSDPHLTSFFRPSLPFYTIEAGVLINFIVVWRLFTPREPLLPRNCSLVAHHCRQLGSLLKIKSLRFLYLNFFFFTLGWTITLQFLSTLLVEHFAATKPIISSTFIGLALIWFLAATVFHPFLMHRLPPKRLLVISLSITTLSLLILAITPVFLLFLHLLFIATLGAALSWKTALALISTDTSFCGKKLAATQSVASIAMIFSPLFGGLVGVYDIATIYLAAALALFLAALACIPTVLKKISHQHD